MNLLDLRGPEFLGVYLIFLVLAVALGLTLRSIARRRGGGGTIGDFANDPGLTPIQVAYVTGGKRLAVNTAIASLYHRRAIRMKGDKLEAVGPPTRVETDDPLEEDVFRRLVTNGSRTVRQVHQSTDVAPIARRPVELGLALPAGDRVQIGVFSVIRAGLVLMLGLAKVAVGLDRNRPVSFLVVLCIVTGIAIIALMATTPLRTRLGDLVLRDLKSESIGLRTTAIANPRSLAVGELRWRWDSSVNRLGGGRNGRFEEGDRPADDEYWFFLWWVVRVGLWRGWWLWGRRMRRGWVWRVRRIITMTNRTFQLGLGIGWRPELALEIERTPDLGFVEITAENFASPAALRSTWGSCGSRGLRVVPHGISLSLGGAEAIDSRRVAHLAAWRGDRRAAGE